MYHMYYRVGHEPPVVALERGFEDIVEKDGMLQGGVMHSATEATVDVYSVVHAYGAMLACLFYCVPVQQPVILKRQRI